MIEASCCDAKNARASAMEHCNSVLALWASSLANASSARLTASRSAALGADGFNGGVNSLAQWLRSSSASMSMIELSSINSITVGMFCLLRSAESHRAHRRTISIWCMLRWKTLKAFAANDCEIWDDSSGE